MVEKEFVIESIFKTKMLLNSIYPIKERMESIADYKNGGFKSLIYIDVMNSLDEIQKNNDFNYFNAFSFIILFSHDYEILKKELLNNTFDLNENFKREDYWRFEDIHFKEGLLLSYSFFNETYKKELSIDIKQLAYLMESKNKDIDTLAKTYLSFRKKILKKSC